MAGQNKQLAINMLAQVVVFLVQMGINFLLTPFIVKSLGVEAYGFVGLSNNIIGYLQLATVALNSMAGRFITIEYHKGNLEQANKYFSSVFYSNVVISAVLAIISIILLVFLEYVIHIPVNLVADVKWLFALLCLNSLLTLVFNVYIVSPFIKNRLDVTSVRNLVSNLIKAAVILVLFGFFSSHLWYIGCSTLICGIYLIIANVKIKDKLTPELGVNLRYFDFVKVKTLLASGVWNLIGKLGDLLQRGLDLLFANWFINAAAMGILSITTQIPFIILSVLGLFTSSFAPSLTKDFAKGKSVPNDTDFLDGEGWIRLIAQGKYHLQEQSVYAKQSVLSHFVRCTHDTACLACLLCPLRTISANALRLRLSLLAGSTERWFERR